MLFVWPHVKNTMVCSQKYPQSLYYDSSQSALLFFFSFFVVFFPHAMLQSHEAETLGTLTVYLHSVFE